MIKVSPVILCGGSGSRLWPLSRSGFPKQFLVFSGTNSLFQQAIDRVNQLTTSEISLGQTLVVTNEEHRFLVLEQLREVQNVQSTLLLEPAARNTAPAITLAALQASDGGEDPVLVVSPADHAVQNNLAFIASLQQSIRSAANGGLVILGIKPDKPETGYGYIQHSGNAGAYGEYIVTQFAEKPSLEVAKAYLANGRHTWNSGIVVLLASTWLRALGQFRPDILAATRAAWDGKTVDALFVRPNKVAFAQVPSESIDYAVLENCPSSKFPLHMVPLDAGWSDLGSWDALWQVNQGGHQDTHGNVVRGDTLLVDTHNTYVHSTSRLVATVGVSDLIIVETLDAVMVTNRTQSENVKKLVSQLKDTYREELRQHRKVHRPWGWYDSIDEGERFKVKRIQVKPGASLSLQKHQHRAEHWIIVKGTAEITKGDSVIILNENQSTFISLGEIHRLSNPGSTPLEIIEVQSGSYLSEDDIVRFQDNYGRTE